MTIITITELRKDIMQKASELTNNFIYSNEHRILSVTNNEIFIPHKYGYIRASRIGKCHNIEDHIHVHLTISKDENGELEAEEIFLVRNVIHLIYQYWIQYKKLRNLNGFFFVYSKDSLLYPEYQSNNILKIVEDLLPKNPDSSIDSFMNENMYREKWIYLGGVFSISFEEKIRTFLKLRRILESHINEIPDLYYCSPFEPKTKKGKIEFGTYNEIEYKNLLMHLRIIEEKNQLRIDYINNNVDYIPYETGEIDEVAKKCNAKYIPITQKSLHQWTEFLDNKLVSMSNINCLKMY